VSVFGMQFRYSLRDGEWLHVDIHSHMSTHMVVHRYVMLTGM